MKTSNHRWVQQANYQTRLTTGTIIMVCCALIFGVCLHFYPYKQQVASPLAEWRGVQNVHFGNIKVYDETGGCGASATPSLFLPTTVFVADSVPQAENFAGGKIAGKGGNLGLQTEAALIERLSGLPDGIRPPAPDLSFAGSETPRFIRDSISGCRQIIYLPDALYWPHSDPPPETTIVCGVIVQGACGWSFVLNSVTPDERRVRDAVVETFQRYLFIAGKGEVYQPYIGIFIDGQRCSEISGGKYAVGM